jgi:hypothetical protein
MVAMSIAMNLRYRLLGPPASPTQSDLFPSKGLSSEYGRGCCALARALGTGRLGGKLSARDRAQWQAVQGCQSWQAEAARANIQHFARCDFNSCQVLQVSQLDRDIQQNVNLMMRQPSVHRIEAAVWVSAASAGLGRLAYLKVVAFRQANALIELIEPNNEARKHPVG